MVKAYELMPGMIYRFRVLDFSDLPSWVRVSRHQVGKDAANVGGMHPFESLPLMQT
jgi:hypothetical protein